MEAPLVVRLLTRASRSRFLRHNGIFFFGAAAVGALNYVYYPVIGRLLDPVSFGEVQALISLFLQITIFLSVMGLVTITVVTNYGSAVRRNAVVLELERLGFYAGLLLLVLAVLFGKQLAEFLHFTSVWPFILLVTALIASVPFTFRSAFLRGKQRFGLTSVANLIGAGSKLLFAAGLVVLGFGSAGAIGGLVLAQIIATIFAARWAMRAGLVRAKEQRFVSLPNFKLLTPELRYGCLVLVGSLIITLQYSIDVLVVKHYFDPHTAGLYAGIASVARIILFLTASIALVMMSMVRVKSPPTENRKLLTKSLVLTSLVGAPIVAACILTPRIVTTVLMGSDYAAVAPVLPMLASAVFVVAILNVFVSYFLALKRYMVMPVLGIGALTTYVLLYVRHNSLASVAESLLFGSLVMLGGLLFWAGSNYVREISWQKS